MPGSCWRECHLDTGRAPSLRENRDLGPPLLPGRGAGCLESLPDRREGGRNVGQPLAAGKSDVIGSLGENQGSRESG